MATLPSPQRGFWAKLAEAERAALSDLGSRCMFRPDSRILAEHDRTNHVVIIWSGHTKVSARARAYGEVLLALRGSGDIVGEMACVGGGLRAATVTAINDVDALVVEADAFIGFLHRFPHASMVLQRVLVARLRHCGRCRVGAVGTNVAQRLARLLLELQWAYGVPNEAGDVRIALTLSQKDLAAFVAASQRAVARELESWRQRGIIVTGRRWVIVRRPSELRRIAGASPHDIVTSVLPNPSNKL
jgi:CRP/FNR family transcriptional regulator, cyclic AMP receptor protein